MRKIRSKIGLGVTLSLESDGVWLYNRSQEPVFVSSPALDAAAAKALLVWRVAPGHCLCIFDPSTPPPAISLPHVGPVDPRSVRISFAKGWGPKYSRRDVTACPCWLEVLLAPASWRKHWSVPSSYLFVCNIKYQVLVMTFWQIATVIVTRTAPQRFTLDNLCWTFPFGCSFSCFTRLFCQMDLECIFKMNLTNYLWIVKYETGLCDMII